jgi:hypothetical protein
MVPDYDGTGQYFAAFQSPYFLLRSGKCVNRKYKNAAKQFLEANLDYCDCPDLMSPHNVAIYGGLTALATFDRTELFKLVISSSQFKVSHSDFLLAELGKIVRKAELWIRIRIQHFRKKYSWQFLSKIAIFLSPS